MKKLFLLAILYAPVITWSAENCIMPKNEANGLHLEGISEGVSKFQVIGSPKERVYFFSVPLDNCKTDKFIIVGDKIYANALFGEYMSVTYTNPKTNVVVKGWIKMSQLKQSSDNTLTEVKKISGGVGSTASGMKLYSITCSNNENYDVTYDPFDNTWMLSEDGSSIEIKRTVINEFAEQFCKGKKIITAIVEKESVSNQKNVQNSLSKIQAPVLSNVSIETTSKQEKVENKKDDSNNDNFFIYVIAGFFLFVFFNKSSSEKGITKKLEEYINLTLNGAIQSEKGGHFDEIENYKKAKPYHEKSLAYHQKALNIINNIGEKKYVECMKQNVQMNDFQKSSESFRLLLAISNNGMGMAYMMLRQDNKAKKHFTEALKQLEFVVNSKFSYQADVYLQQFFSISLNDLISGVKYSINLVNK
jgi:tetratricopeptide (TPR) repeat protein